MKENISSEDIRLDPNDHREIGKRLDLFSFSERGPGFPFFHPKGLALRNALIDCWRVEHGDYQEIQSPIMLDRKLWEMSGHWELYKDHMYVSEVEKHAFALKPMNCPGAILYYQQKKRSHSELPLRVCEMGQVHRDEFSGSLHGLMRARAFVVDDGHIFCSEDHLLDEVKKVLVLAQKVLRRCGFDKFIFELSVRSAEKKDKYLGGDREWHIAEEMLKLALEELDLPYEVKEGEAKFYGPAIDLKVQDSGGRLWQCSSVQMDFNLGKRFGVCYYDEAGKKQIPFILHRCLYGSLERFIGVLLEHHKGDLPFWLAPVQIHIHSLDEASHSYIEEIGERLHRLGIRVEVNLKNEHIKQKIKRSQAERIPLMLIIGKCERENNQVSLRSLQGKMKQGLPIWELEKVISIFQRGEHPDWG